MFVTFLCVQRGGQTEWNLWLLSDDIRVLVHSHQWFSAVVCVIAQVFFQVNNTNKCNSAVLNRSLNGCSLSPPVKACALVHIQGYRAGDETESHQAFSRCSCVNNTVPYEGQSGFSGIRRDLVHVTFNHHICWGAIKYNTLIPSPLRLFRNMAASLGITFDLINHFRFYYLRVKSASSYSPYFEINPLIYTRVSSSVSCSD